MPALFFWRHGADGTHQAMLGGGSAHFPPRRPAGMLVSGRRGSGLRRHPVGGRAPHGQQLAQLPNVFEFSSRIVHVRLRLRAFPLEHSEQEAHRRAQPGSDEALLGALPPSMNVLGPGILGSGP